MFPELGRQKQAGLYEFEDSSGLHSKFKVGQGYIVKAMSPTSKLLRLQLLIQLPRGFSLGRNSPGPQLPSRVLL